MCDRPPDLLGWAFRPRNFMKNPPRRINGEQEANMRRGFSTLSLRTRCGARTHACSVHTFQKPLDRSIDFEPLSGAANPGCSRLLGGLLRARMHWFPAKETPPPGSSFARVNAFCSGACAKWRRAGQPPRPRWFFDPVTPPESTTGPVVAPALMRRILDVANFSYKPRLQPEVKLSC
jgi:hypothetical protein